MNADLLILVINYHKRELGLTGQSGCFLSIPLDGAATAPENCHSYNNYNHFTRLPSFCEGFTSYLFLLPASMRLPSFPGFPRKRWIPYPVLLPCQLLQDVALQVPPATVYSRSKPAVPGRWKELSVLTLDK